MLANTQASNTSSTHSSHPSLSDPTLSSSSKKSSSKATLRKDLDETLGRMLQLEQDQETMKKINIKLTAEVKSIRQQLKTTQSLLASKEEVLWQISRKIMGDEAMNTGVDMTSILETADRASASHKGGLVGRIEELNQHDHGDETNQAIPPATSPLPSPADEHVHKLLQILYTDMTPDFASSEVRGICWHMTEAPNANRPPLSLILGGLEVYLRRRKCAQTSSAGSHIASQKL